MVQQPDPLPLGLLPGAPGSHVRRALAAGEATFYTALEGSEALMANINRLHIFVRCIGFNFYLVSGKIGSEGEIVVKL